MKILNKNRKLKFSKMFIDEKIYKQVCSKYNVDLKEHLMRLSAAQDDFENPGLTLDDLNVMGEIYLRITKVIRRR